MTAPLDVEEPGVEPDLPRGWRWARLGGVCTVVSGATPKTEVNEYWDGDIPWVTPTDLGRLAGPFLDATQRYITSSGLASCSARLVPVGTVLMSSRAPIGHLAIARVACCTNQGCKNLVPGPAVESQFLFYAMTLMMPALKAIGRGATFAEVSKATVESFRIPLPPLPDQRRIAAVLTDRLAAVDRMRAVAEARLAAAEALPNACLRAVFDGDEARAWPTVPLAQVCESSGQYGTSEKASSVAAGLPVLRMGNLKDMSISWDDLKYLSLPAAEERKYRLHEGDILFNRTNSAELVGKSAVFDEARAAVFASYLIRFRVRPDVMDPWFLCAYINSPFGRRFIEANMARAIGQVNISASTMATMPVPPPPLPMQRAITSRLVAQLEGAKVLHAALDAHFSSIGKLPSALLREAFTGRL